jgi:type I pantothenate kinase
MSPQRQSEVFSPYREFTREEWAALRADTPMTLSEEEVERLSGLTERISGKAVREI